MTNIQQWVIHSMIEDKTGDCRNQKDGDQEDWGNQQSLQKSSLVRMICLGVKDFSLWNLHSSFPSFLCLCLFFIFIFQALVPFPQKCDHLGYSWPLLKRPKSSSILLFTGDSRCLQCTVRLIEPSNPISAFKSGLRFLWRQHNNFLPTLEPDHHRWFILCPRASGWGPKGTLLTPSTTSKALLLHAHMQAFLFEGSSLPPFSSSRLS